LELTLDSTDATPGPVIEVGGGIAAQPTKSDTAEINRLGAKALWYFFIGLIIRESYLFAFALRKTPPRRRIGERDL
jgi:hypothetical protein